MVVAMGHGRAWPLCGSGTPQPGEPALQCWGSTILFSDVRPVKAGTVQLPRQQLGVVAAPSPLPRPRRGGSCRPARPPRQGPPGCHGPPSPPRRPARILCPSRNIRTRAAGAVSRAQWQGDQAPRTHGPSPLEAPSATAGEHQGGSRVPFPRPHTGAARLGAARRPPRATTRPLSTAAEAPAASGRDREGGHAPCHTWRAGRCRRPRGARRAPHPRAPPPHRCAAPAPAPAPQHWRDDRTHALRYPARGARRACGMAGVLRAAVGGRGALALQHE
jgi:hypothetical protein